MVSAFFFISLETNGFKFDVPPTIKNKAYLDYGGCDYGECDPNPNLNP